MSKKAGPKARDRVPPRAAHAADAPNPPPPEFPPPLKPRPRLFYGLLALLAVWVGILLVLYFTTVYPNRRPQPQAGDAPAAPRETVPQ